MRMQKAAPTALKADTAPMRHPFGPPASPAVFLFLFLPSAVLLLWPPLNLSLQFGKFAKSEFRE